MDGTGQGAAARGGGEGFLAFWPEGEVWFREGIRGDLPWGDESLLEEVPPDARGCYGIQEESRARLRAPRPAARMEVVESREALRGAVEKGGAIKGAVFPWYGRIVPPALLAPHLRRIDLAVYRRDVRGQFLRGLLVSGALVGAGLAFPQLFIPALLGAVLFGLFPLVEAAMAWPRRVDRIPVDELNRRLVNNELFRRWMGGRPAGGLKAGVAVLGLIFAGQYAAGLDASIERAALVHSAVLEGGEWWRILTTGLLHGNLIHIVFNGLALYTLGRVVFALSSPALLTIVFFVSVLTGSLASLWAGTEEASVGASGGILGCLGFLLVVTAKFRGSIPGYLRAACLQATIVIAIFGALGHRFIDNAAHAGGFLGGIALGLALYPGLKLGAGESSVPLKWLGGFCAAALLAGAGKVAFELWSVFSGA